MIKKFMLGSTLLAASSLASAEMGPVLGLALTFGGDDVASYDVEYRGGGDGSEDIKAGGFMYLYTGFYADLVEQEAQDFGVQVNLGYHFDEISADNGDASFSRTVIELIPYWQNELVRVGLGLAQHSNVEFDDSTGTGVDAEFDDALGLVLTADYRVSPKVVLGLRYVSIDYELASINSINVNSDEEFDGSHIGIAATLLF